MDPGASNNIPHTEEDAWEKDKVENWFKDPKGNGILDDGRDSGGGSGYAGSGSGRSDLYAWVRDRRDAFDRLLEEYSGDSLAAIERQLAKTRGVFYQTGLDRGGVQDGRGSTGQLDQAKSPADSVRVTGVHFSKSPREVLSSAFQGTNAAGRETSRLPEIHGAVRGKPSP